MAWARIDDTMPTHPKVATVGPVAELVAYRAICYANRYLTDGFIPKGAVRHLTTGLSILTGDSEEWFPETIAARLVSAGLWDKVRSGWLIHDYLEYNFSRAQIQANRENGRIGGKISASVRLTKRSTVGSTDAQAISPTPLSTTPSISPPSKGETDRYESDSGIRTESDDPHTGQHPRCRRCRTARRHADPANWTEHAGPKPGCLACALNQPHRQAPGRPQNYDGD
jgi:hypothetical protein